MEIKFEKYKAISVMTLLVGVTCLLWFKNIFALIAFTYSCITAIGMYKRKYEYLALVYRVTFLLELLIIWFVLKHISTSQLSIYICAMLLTYALTTFFVKQAEMCAKPEAKIDQNVLPSYSWGNAISLLLVAFARIAKYVLLLVFLLLAALQSES